MSHTKIVGKIYETTNYEQFKFRKDNRSVKDQIVNKLVKSLEFMGQKMPIKVDKNMYVNDGQHRLQACKILKLPVIYIIDDKTMNTSEIAQLQSATKSWNYNDYAKSFASSTNSNVQTEDYKLYNLFCKTYPEFGHSVSAMLLNNGLGIGSSFDAAFKGGTFKVKSYNKARTIAEALQKMRPFYAGYFKRSFVSAFNTMYNTKDFSLERLMRKLPKRCKEIHDFSKTEDYLDTLQDIYNWKETKKVYFH